MVHQRRVGHDVRVAGFHFGGVDSVIWEHGRRNFALREHGLLPIVLPASDDSDWAGIGIFDAPAENVRAIMDADPGVAAGIFTYEVHSVRGFPGTALPGD